MSGVGNFSPYDYTTQHQTANHLQEDIHAQNPMGMVSEELVEPHDTEEAPDIREVENANNNQPPTKPDSPLFDRVTPILEQARANVVRSVNSEMVIAYWLIGREIVEEVQQGEKRAGYGKRLIEDLSDRLADRYGEGFSTTNRGYFRWFYITFHDHSPAICHSRGGELPEPENPPLSDSDLPAKVHTLYYRAPAEEPGPGRHDRACESERGRGATGGCYQGSVCSGILRPARVTQTG